MTRVRIDNATYLVTVDPTDQVLRNATIHIEDGRITAITEAGTGAASKPEGDAAGRHPADPARQEAEADASLRPLAGSGGSAERAPRAQRGWDCGERA